MVLRYGRGNMRCMKGVYENTDEDSPFRRRPDFDLLHLKNGAQDTLPVNQSVYQIKVYIPVLRSSAIDIQELHHTADSWLCDIKK